MCEERMPQERAQTRSRAWPRPEASFARCYSSDGVSFGIVTRHIHVGSTAPPLVGKWGVHPASGFVSNLSRILVCSSLLEELERPQCAACRNIREVRVWRLERVDAADAAGDRDVLFSVTFPGDRLTDDSGRRLKLPENLAGIDIDGDELS